MVSPDTRLSWGSAPEFKPSSTNDPSKQTPTPPNNNDASTFSQRLDSLQNHQDDSIIILIQDMIEYCRDLEETRSGGGDGDQADPDLPLLQQITTLQLTLQNSDNFGRALQRRLEHAENRLGLMVQNSIDAQTRNPYAIALIDGEGLIFLESFMKQGRDGGAKAADALHREIVKQCGNWVVDPDIFVKVIADMQALSRVLVRDGSIDCEETLRHFAAGFSRARPFFDFIDVGYDSEGCSTKIQHLADWNIRNPTCKQILLGVAHNKSYAPWLRRLVLQDRTRIAVIKGGETALDIESVRAETVNFTGTVFRREKLGCRQPSAGVIGSGKLKSQIDMVRSASSSSRGSDTLSSPPSLTMSAASTPVSSIASLATTPKITLSYAAAIVDGIPPRPITVALSLPKLPSRKPPTAPKKTSEPAPTNQNQRQQSDQHQDPPVTKMTTTVPWWRPGPRGLDKPILANLDVLEALKHRKTKLCHTYYLRGECIKGALCSFEHEHVPTKQEMQGMAFLSRLNPCVRGQACEVDECIYGHHCPSVHDGWCTHPFCRYAIEDHPAYTQFKNPTIREN